MLSLQDILQVLVSSSFIKDLFDLLKQLQGAITERRLQGIYEVLDQRRTVTIHDPQGRAATVDTIQHLRFRQNHVTAITEYAWGEGELFATYHCMPGVPVDCYREGSRHVMLISLREHKNVGDELILRTRRRIENGFRKREEYWESDIYHRTQRMELRIIFRKNGHARGRLSCSAPQVRQSPSAPSATTPSRMVGTCSAGPPPSPS